MKREKVSIVVHPSILLKSHSYCYLRRTVRDPIPISSPILILASSEEEEKKKESHTICIQVMKLFFFWVCFEKNPKR